MRVETVTCKQSIFIDFEGNAILEIDFNFSSNGVLVFEGDVFEAKFLDDNTIILSNDTQLFCLNQKKFNEYFCVDGE